MAIAGKVAITPKGEWNANTAYTKLDLVFYENASYVAIQPSTGVEPTNTAYWMLMVQSAGGADLEAIIDGTTQVGNAKTLDGHGAEDFFPKSGGTIDGNVALKSTKSEVRMIDMENALRRVNFQITADGRFILNDSTNGTKLMQFSADALANSFNGTASGNLPKRDGTVERYLYFQEYDNGKGVMVKNHNETVDNGFVIQDRDKDGNQATIKLCAKQNTLKYEDNSRTNHDILHTGNKPTGTYTGNGSATARTINTGGTGNLCLIYVKNSSYAVLATPNGAFRLNGDEAQGMFATNCKFADGVLTIADTSAYVNTNGWTYNYQVL